VVEGLVIVIVLITAYFVATSAQIRIAKENKLALQITCANKGAAPEPKTGEFFALGAIPFL
jgi:hypothetical protein